MAVRPLDSTARNALMASAGSALSTRRAAPACTTIMLTLCVTTSCSSLARRARSSASARLVAASCSAWAWRSRAPESPARRAHRWTTSPTIMIGMKISSDVARAGMGSVVSAKSTISQYGRQGHAEQRGAAVPAVHDGRVGGERHDEEDDKRRAAVGVDGVGSDDGGHDRPERSQRKDPAQRQRRRSQDDQHRPQWARRGTGGQYGRGGGRRQHDVDTDGAPGERRPRLGGPGERQRPGQAGLHQPSPALAHQPIVPRDSPDGIARPAETTPPRGRPDRRKSAAAAGKLPLAAEAGRDRAGLACRAWMP